MSHKAGWIHQLRWGNPRTSPPNGLPVVLGEWSDREPTSADFKAVYPDYRLGCGYSHAIQFPVIVSNRRKLTAEENTRRKERAAKTAEANRIRRKLPLLADVLIQQEGLDWRRTKKTDKQAVQP